MRKFIGEQRTNLNPTKWFNVWKHLGKKVLGSNFVEITITHEHKSAGTKFFFLSSPQKHPPSDEICIWSGGYLDSPASFLYIYDPFNIRKYGHFAAVMNITCTRKISGY